MDSGKRVRLDVGSANSLKKQKLAGSAGSDNEESSNGVDRDESLESFRKAAIWREMSEYKRKFSRAQTTVDALELERNQCDARLSAVDLSWNQLVQEAELLLPSTSNLTNGHARAAASPAVSDPTLSDEQLEIALTQRSLATKNLLKRLSELHPSEHGDDKVDELTAKCRTLLSDSLKSREALRLLRAQHDSTVAQLERTHTDLIRAEKRLDRLQSSTVAALEANSSTQNGPGGSSTPAGPKALSPVPKVESPKVEAPVPMDMTMTNALNAELEDLRTLVDSRARDIEELRNDRVTLGMELDALKLKLVDVPDEVVVESVPFRLLQNHVQHLAHDHESKRVELEKVNQEADEMREMQTTFREQIMREATEEVDEIQKKLLLKESDLTRIRTQREDFRAELTELKAKESEKVKNLDQLRLLASSREDRVIALGSEVRRLKMQIAALEGDGMAVDMYAEEQEENVVKDLQGRLKTAEDLLLALRDQLNSYSAASETLDAQTIVNSETEARKELHACQARLASLEKLLGPEGNVEIADLVQQLKEREERVKVLDAQMKSQDHATNMLYGEIDRLSAAWSILDEQSASKVFNLVDLAEKVQRLNTDRAKADNRYFSTMRQKDAIVAENTVLTKLAEKQQRAVESANDMQHSIGNQLTAAEKEITLHINHVRSHRDKITDLTRENGELVLRNQQNVKHITELNSLLADRISQAESEIAARQRLEEQVARNSRELRDAKARGGAGMGSGPIESSSGSGGSKEMQELKLYSEDLAKMLKCSTCNLRFKSVIINRCSHLFCKECVDDRIANRSRKCPTCQTPFGQADVSPVYF